MSYTPPSYDPPPYVPLSDESKGLYASVASEQHQQQPLAAPTAPHQSSVTYDLPTGLEQEQQRQQLVASTQTSVAVRETEGVQPHWDHLSLACFVICCCAWPCGCIAFILARK